MFLLQGKMIMNMKKIDIMKIEIKIINIEMMNMDTIEIKIATINMRIVNIKIINIAANPSLVHVLGQGLVQEVHQEKNNTIKEIEDIEGIKNYIQNILQNLIPILKNLPRKISTKIYYHLL